MSTDTAAPAGKIQPRLKQKYNSEIKKALQDEFGYANVMQIPGLVKVVVNTGVGEAARDSKVIDGAVDDLTKITGQKPIVTKARKSSRSSSCVRARPSARTSPSAVTARGSSWTVSSRWLCPVSATSAVSRASSSTATATTPSVSRSRACSTRSIRTRSTGVRGFDITVVTTAKTDDEGRAAAPSPRLPVPLGRRTGVTLRQAQGPMGC